MTKTLYTSLCAGTAIVMTATPAAAQAQEREYNIPAGSLKRALDAYARQSGVQVIYRVDDVRGVKSKGVRGKATSDRALDAILSGTGFAGRRDASGAVAIIDQSTHSQAIARGEPRTASEDAGQRTGESDIVVVGTRIRGAPPSSPVISISRVQMEDSGKNDLGEVMRSVPQNFGGGQNPGVGLAPRADGSTFNRGGTSAPNLRGLGPDSTLTLLNGQRLSSDGANGGVDIASIPIHAVERLEIVVDGASALYGSDAVGGVVNIVTKREFKGLTATSLYGTSTDGGFQQQQYSATVGTAWSTGSVIASASYSQNSEITASQRSYTVAKPPETYLYPSLRRINLFASARQKVTGNVEFAIDGVFSNIRSDFNAAFSTTAPLSSNGFISTTRTESFAIAPRLSLNLGEWKITAYSAFARSRSRVESALIVPTASFLTNSCICNSYNSQEVSADGPLLDIPGGPIRVSLGVGRRVEDSTSSSVTNNVASSGNFVGQNRIRYAFNEFDIPIFGQNNSIPLVDSLRLSAALRFEDYNVFGSEFLPKLGLRYGITPSFTLSGSWGESFKAPRFGQRFGVVNASLSRVTGNEFPANSTVLSLAGGNPNLLPERASTTTITAQYRPPFDRNLSVALSYFRIDYRNRVVVPFLTTAGVLGNPTLSDFVRLNPTSSAQAAALALDTDGILTNSTGAAYDPTRVVAIIDGRQTNATAQNVTGFDLFANYTLQLGTNESLTLSSSSSYLRIEQTFLPTSPSVELTGQFYRPRSFSTRNGAVWKKGEFSLSGFVSFTGGAKFPTGATRVDIDPVTTLDVVARIKLPNPIGASLTLQALNLFNEKPSIIPLSGPTELNFDGSAYSSTGRVISVQLTKAF